VRSGWVGRRRLHLDGTGRTVSGMAATAALAAATTGSRLILVGALAGALLVVLDAVSAARALPADPVAVQIPDGPAGTVVNHDLLITGARRAVIIGRPGAGGARVRIDAGPDRAVVAATAALPLPARGLYGTERFTVEVAGPLGLVQARRVQRTRHDPALAVGPAPVPHDLRWPVRTATAGTDGSRPARGDDLFRGVRPYRPGDARRSVHWPATARQGSLMVRETEGLGRPAVRIVVGFATPGPAAEAALGRAAWAADEARRAGFDVWLVINAIGLARRSRQAEGNRIDSGANGPDGSLDRAVRGPGDVGRRLAAAGPGQPAARPAAVPTRWITPAGDRWT
jgi:uncharacterized protein (DUF58 family)